jgi:regulator of sigma D
MLDQATQSLVKFSGHSNSLDRWLQHRQLLVSGYFHMITKAQASTLPQLSDVRYWCVELVDYLTAGHFQVFSELVPVANAPQQTADEFDAKYSSISSTTDDLLKMQETVFSLNEDNNVALQEMLSGLGETLAKRLEMEDLLISISISQKEESPA